VRGARARCRILDRCDLRQTPSASVCPKREAGSEGQVTAMFLLYVVVIAAGCGACIVIGLVQ
jgi:hypothetical protein